MNPIEIIVTQADTTPTSSTNALNKIATSSAAATTSATPRPNLELHFNALSKPPSNAKVSPTNRNHNNRRNPPNHAKNGDAITTDSSSNYNTPATSSDESKRPLLPDSPDSSSSLQLTKKIKILPSSTSNSTATASSTPSPTTNNVVPNRANPPSNFPPQYLFLCSFFLLLFVFVGSCCLLCRSNPVFVLCIVNFKAFACACGCSLAPIHPSIPYLCPRRKAEKTEEATQRCSSHHLPISTQPLTLHRINHSLHSHEIHSIRIR